MIQDALADSQALGGTFQQFIVRQKFQTLL
jgi:hypothetical protein